MAKLQVEPIIGALEVKAATRNLAASRVDGRVGHDDPGIVCVAAGAGVYPPRIVGNRYRASAGQEKAEKRER
ncbi:MAG TPA: hypothetical protein VML75_18720 [Kofleriaceae bacterium]|nr:hypothetical protein [Kofleriaceae bacterium]